MAQHAGSAGSFFRKPAPPAGPPPPTFRPPLPPSGLGIPDAVPRPLPAARRRLSFHGTGGTLFGLHVVNVFFTVLTLGVYYFWGKTRIRRYLFGESAFEGDRFAYHGTPKELLLGFAKAFLVFFVPIVVLTVVRDVLDVGPVIQRAAAVSISLLFLVFLPVAMVGARRYRLSRTSWRGIRFSFRGVALEFVVQPVEIGLSQARPRRVVHEHPVPFGSAARQCVQRIANREVPAAATAAGVDPLRARLRQVRPERVVSGHGDHDSDHRGIVEQ